MYQLMKIIKHMRQSKVIKNIINFICEEIELIELLMFKNFQSMKDGIPFMKKM